jgi:hypothetical protein
VRKLSKDKVHLFPARKMPGTVVPGKIPESVCLFFFRPFVPSETNITHIFVKKIIKIHAN